MNRTRFFAFFALMSLAQPLFASDSSGTRGGGQTIDINGRPSLKDLVERTVCRWAKGTTVRDSLPEFKTILKKLESIHWYYSNRVSHAASELRVCLTDGSLSHLDTKDKDGLTIGEQAGDQVAIRWDSTVYLDKKIFNRMDAKNKAYLFFHEVMHTFIPTDASQRNIKLRSFVKATEDFVEGRMSAAEYLDQVPEDNVQWPRKIDREALEPLRVPLSQLFADDEDSHLAGAVALERLSGYLELRGALRKWDTSRIEWLARGARDELRHAISNCDMDRVRVLRDRVKVPVVAEPSRIWGDSGELPLYLRDDVLVQVKEWWSGGRGVVEGVIRKSNANIELGLNDESCLETLRYLRALPELRVAYVVSSERAASGNARFRVMNPELAAIFFEEALPQIEKHDAEVARERHAFISKCAASVDCSYELLLDIDKELKITDQRSYYSFYGLGTGQSLMLQSKDQIKALAADLMADSAFDAQGVERKLRKRLPNWASLGR